MPLYFLSFLENVSLLLCFVCCCPEGRFKLDFFPVIMFFSPRGPKEFLSFKCNHFPSICFRTDGSGFCCWCACHMFISVTAFYLLISLPSEYCVLLYLPIHSSSLVECNFFTFMPGYVLLSTAHCIWNNVELPWGPISPFPKDLYLLAVFCSRILS